MKILYSAIDQTVPGTVGGSVHVAAVAEGLAALGHDVHVLVTPGAGGFPAGAGALVADAAAVRAHAAAHGRGAGEVTRLARELGPTRSSSGTTTSAAKASSPAALAGADGARGERAGDRSRGLVQGAARPGAARPADAALARAPLRARRPHRHAERRDPAAGHAGRRRSCELEWGADTERFSPDATGHAARSSGRAGDGGDLRRRVPHLARRDSPGRGDQGAAARAATTTVGACSSATARSCRAVRARRRTGSTRSSSPARCRTTRCPRPGRRRHRRGAVRHRGARAARARVLLVAAEDLRVHGRGTAGGRAGDCADRRRWWRTSEEGVLVRSGPEAGALAADASSA